MIVWIVFFYFCVYFTELIRAKRRIIPAKISQIACEEYKRFPIELISEFTTSAISHLLLVKNCTSISESNLGFKDETIL